jgi:hypothetical protein
MYPRSDLKSVVLLLLIVGGPRGAIAADPLPLPSASRLRGVLLAADQVTQPRLRELVATGTTAIVVELRSSDTQGRKRQVAASQQVQQSGLAVYYWIEIARCPELADAHPRWMASLQGHSEWRRLFKDAPRPADDEVVKAYPWVPVLYEEAFQAQLSRVEQLLREMPQPKGVFLNDLQGGPSACGCGNPLCRWTSDYGKIRTATVLGKDAAANFTSEVAKLLPQSDVIPVWTTECEQHDGAADGLCAGVGCFNGICWKAYTEQLAPVVAGNKTLGALLPFKAFQRDLPLYGAKAGWVRRAIESFRTMPPRHGAKPIPASRLIAVLQGWDVSDEDIAAQVRMATSAGAAGYVVSHLKIDQSWEPRLVKWK